MLPSLVLSADWKLYSDIESLTYSEAMSIKGFIDNFSGELESGSKALTHDKAEFGAFYQDWWIAKVFRYDYTLSFSEDTAFLNYQIENNRTIDESRSYNISLKAKHMRSTGFTLGKRWQILPTLMLSTSASWLASEQFYDGTIALQVEQGDFNASDVDEFESLAAGIDISALQTFADLVGIADTLQEASNQLRNDVSTSNISAYANYYYYKPALREDEFDEFNDVQLTDPSGQGFTTDIQLSWQFHPNWRLGIEAKDAYSRIEWENAPATTVRAEATQAALDGLDVVDQFIAEDVIKRSEGQFFSPLNPENPDDPAAALPEIQNDIVEQRSDVNVRNETFIQRLPSQVLVQVDHQVSPWLTTTVGYLDTEVAGFPHVKARFFQHYWLRYEVEASAYGVGFDSRFFRFGFMADSADLDTAKYLYLKAALTLPLW